MNNTAGITKGFKEALLDGDFVMTAEVGPPKGTDVEQMLKDARILKGKVHALNVTDNQSSVMRMGSLAGCHLLKDEGIEPVFQLTCRDRNRMALQSDLLSAHALGVRTVLSLTGDFVSAGDHPGAKPVFDLESVQLLECIERMNNGHDLSTAYAGKELPNGTPLKGNTDFFAGAVVTPEADPLEPQLMKFGKKIAAGAQFFQTQAVYDMEKFYSFLDTVEPYNTRIIAGILLLKSAGMARFLNKFVPGIVVPDSLIEELKASSEPLKTGVSIAARQIKALKGRCSGVHIMAIGLEHLVPEIIAEAGV